MVDPYGALTRGLNRRQATAPKATDAALSSSTVDAEAWGSFLAHMTAAIAATEGGTSANHPTAA
jgi:hypothetical protein